MKDYIQITIRSKKDTKQIEYGRQFLTTMIEADSRLEPEYFDCVLSRYNNSPYENMENALDRWTTIKELQGYTDKVLGNWAAKWKRKSVPKYSCEMDHMLINNRGEPSPSDFGFTAKWNAKIDWIDLFRRWCEVADAQIAMLHHFTDSELINEYCSFEMGSLGILWRPTFSDISWGMFFGDEFAQYVDVEKFTSLGFLVDPIGSGYLVRVTDNLLDVSKQYDFFAERREILRAELPQHIFPDPDEEERNRAELGRLIRERDAREQSGGVL